MTVGNIEERPDERRLKKLFGRCGTGCSGCESDSLSVSLLVGAMVEISVLHNVYGNTSGQIDEERWRETMNLL